MEGMEGMMGGMGMSSDGGMFTGTNEAIAKGFWYGVAGVVGILTVNRAILRLQRRQRLNTRLREPPIEPSKRRTWLAQSYATATAASREMLYPQPIYLTGRVSRFFTPMPVGRWILLAIYWTFVLTSLWSNTILYPDDPMYPYKWEKVGFRAAWVSVTQIPFIYLLSCKFNPISLLTGISYERFNWLHRWAARTVFLTVIVHWSFFFTQWSIGDYVEIELQMMPMVKYGFGAWAVITWMVLTGFGFFRSLNYELFVVQHIAAAGALLWLLFVHVPSYARYNIWLSVGFLAFDWGARIIGGVLRNTHISSGMKNLVPGYSAQVEPLPGGVVRLTLENVDFRWKAGQHAYITIPRLRPFEIHPFTIANTALPGSNRQPRSLTMLIQARTGFTKALHTAATRLPSKEHQYRAFISGPWGYPPELSQFETVVMIACGTGASFIVPILEDLVRRPQNCVTKIKFHWIMRTQEHLGWFATQLKDILQQTTNSTTSLDIHVHVTSQVGNDTSAESILDSHTLPITTRVISLSSSTSSEDRESGRVAQEFQDEKSPLSPTRCSSVKQSRLSVSYKGRPTVESMIRGPVEDAVGETAIVVCGGLSITAQSRSIVAALSDERAVHKGTGAQGIFLYTESYGY